MEAPNGLGSGCLDRQVKRMQAGSINYHGLDRVTKLGQLRLPFPLPEIKFLSY